MTVDNAVIDTAGVIRTAIWAGGDADLTVTNSVISAYESLSSQEEYDALVVPMMKRTPFALGMEGVVRATNVWAPPPPPMRTPSWCPPAGAPCPPTPALATTPPASTP